MTEQKQSLADFVFENKDKMPDNVYKILMEQYAKEENDKNKGFVEVEYRFPIIKKWGDNGHRLLYEKKVAITKKYDDRYGEQYKEMKLGMMSYSRITRNPYHSVGSMEYDISLIENDADGEGLELKYDGEDTYLLTEQVFVVSVRDL